MVTLQRTTGFALMLLALGAFTIFTPLAFAEEDVDTDAVETTDVDYEEKAEDKIELVEEALEEAEEYDEEVADEAVRSERAEVREEIKDILSEARELWNDGEYEAAYELAREAYGMIDKHKNAVKAKAKRVYENCTDEDGCENKMKKRAVACKVDMLEDGEEDMKFCRNGEWKEKREAKLDDIMSGFVEAADLTDEQSEQIREEVQALVRQLISLILANRISS